MKSSLSKLMLTAVTVASISAFSGGAALADQASMARVSEASARQAADRYLRKEGFTRPLYSQRTARVGKARFVDGAWEVEIRFGGNLPDKSGVVIVDADSGMVRRAE